MLIKECDGEGMDFIILIDFPPPKKNKYDYSSSNFEKYRSMEQNVESQWEGGDEWVGGKRLTKELVCICTQPMDTDNGVVKAWGQR